MRKFQKLCAASALFLCLCGCSDHDTGVRQGREDARKARGEMGEVGAKIAGGIVENMPGKVDSSKSAEWNAGYREGVRKELQGK